MYDITDTRTETNDNINLLLFFGFPGSLPASLALQSRPYDFTSAFLSPPPLYVSSGGRRYLDFVTGEDTKGHSRVISSCYRCLLRLIRTFVVYESALMVKDGINSCRFMTEKVQIFFFNVFEDLVSVLG